MIDNRSIVTPQQPWLIFASFSLWSFFMLCRPQDYLLFLGQLRPGLTLGIITLILWMLKAQTGVHSAGDRQVRLYGYLVLVMAASVPLSYYRVGSFSDLIHYSTVPLFVFLFYRFIDTENKLRKVIHLYCVGIGVYALCVLLNGSSADGRVFFGTMFDPNDIAFYILSFLTFNILFITRDNGRFTRVLAFASVATGVIIILKTGSRGGLISLLTVIGYLSFRKKGGLRISVGTKILVAFLTVVTLQFVEMNSERYRSIFTVESDYNTTSEEGRVAIWKTGMRLMITHPFTGVGFNRFPEAVGRDREARGLDSAKWQTAHNSVVQIGAETGVFGFILFCLLSLNAYKIFSQVADLKDARGLARLGEMAKAGFIGHFTSAMFLSQAYSVYWAFFIVLSAVLRRLAARHIPGKVG